MDFNSNLISTSRLKEYKKFREIPKNIQDRYIENAILMVSLAYNQLPVTARNDKTDKLFNKYGTFDIRDEEADSRTVIRENWRAFLTKTDHVVTNAKINMFIKNIQIMQEKASGMSNQDSDKIFSKEFSQFFDNMDTTMTQLSKNNFK